MALEVCGSFKLFKQLAWVDLLCKCADLITLFILSFSNNNLECHLRKCKCYNRSSCSIQKRKAF